MWEHRRDTEAATRVREKNFNLKRSKYGASYRVSNKSARVLSLQESQQV